jgi:hypothetical protein
MCTHATIDNLRDLRKRVPCESHGQAEIVRWIGVIRRWRQ